MDNLIAWAIGFFSIPETANFWTVLNSPILVALIAAIIGWQLNQRITSAKEDAEAAHSEAQVAIKVAEASDERLDIDELESSVSTDSAVPNTDNYREQFRQLADQAKAFIDTKIKNDTDKRHQRTYARFSGHHPVSRAIALKERDRITAEQEHTLITILRTWNRYNKGLAANRPVPRAVYDLMEKNWKSVDWR